MLNNRVKSPYLARNSSVVGTALPKTPAEPFNIANSLLLIRKINFPNEGPVAEHPHSAVKLALPWQQQRRSELDER